MTVKIDTDANIARVRFAEQGSNPSTPAAGFGYVFEKADQQPYFMNASGTVGQIIVSGALVEDKKTLANGDKTTTSTSFVDIDSNLNITLTTGARRCLVVFSAVGKNSGTGQTQVDVDVDGSRAGQTYGLVLGGGVVDVNFNMSYSFLTDVLSAGSHTFKPQWRVDTGTGTLYASTSVCPIFFSVIELPN